MKRLTIILLLMIMILPVCFGGVCFAQQASAITQDTSAYKYYYTKSQIAVYDSSEEGNVLFHIPYTYAFQLLTNDTQAQFVKISYNGYEGYIKTQDFLNNTSITTTNWEKYYFDINFDITASPNVTFYEIGFASSVPVPVANTQIDKVYSYLYRNVDGKGEYYFLVDYTYDGNSKTRYIKASDTTLADFDTKYFAENPNEDYVIETTPVTPSGDNNSGDVDDSGITQPTNNLERYLLITVIAVLCLIIVVLIFLPNKRNKNSHF